MTKNIGSLDRLARLLIGLVLIGTAAFYSSPVLAIFGIFTLFEAVSSWCVFYQLIGRNTCPLPNSHPGRRIPLFRYYLTGIGILFTAIILNLLTGYLDWSTWYEILSYRHNLTQVSLDNWLFLVIFYPLILALASITIYTKSAKKE